MTRLALPAILVIGAFSSAALAAPVSAGPWSSTGTPTPLLETRAGSQAHCVSSRDVHSRVLTTRGLALSRYLDADTQFDRARSCLPTHSGSPFSKSNPTTTNSGHASNGENPLPSGLVGLHPLWNDEIAMINESRGQRKVPKLDSKSDSLDALRVADWKVLVDYYEKRIQETTKAIQTQLPRIEEKDSTHFAWTEHTLYARMHGDEEHLLWARKRMELAKQKAASANTVPEPHWSKKN
ncbi:hypothetical protein FB446DRAFT_791826 [Lentinula raphanica]|nr:hypothetical protein FB446DRAFT_791826 [Lentinula raphanica]